MIIRPFEHFAASVVAWAVVGSAWSSTPNSVAQTSPTTTPVIAAEAGLTGTLFYSDVDRAKIEAALRKSKGVQRQAPTEDERNMIHGWIRRGDGDTMVWVDGRMIGPLNAQHASKVTAAAVGGLSEGAILISQQLSVKPAVNPRSGPASIPKKRKVNRAP